LEWDTIDGTQDGCWSKSFSTVAFYEKGFAEKYWKRWEPAKRAADKLGYHIVRVQLKKVG
jgi:uncharacterized membrane protein